jgi:GNAT superfamily N-acetyltransferase
MNAPMEPHPLARHLREAANGRFPPQDHAFEVLPAVKGLAAAVVGFSGHNFIATDIDSAEVLSHLPSQDPGAALSPPFLCWLGDRLSAWTYTPDLVLSAFYESSDASFLLIERHDVDDHPRVQLARRYRSDVRVYSDASGEGLITIARNKMGLLSVSVEVEPHARDHGLARKLIQAARSLIPQSEPLFASVSPGNAASVRAFLAAGYSPICSEVAMLSKREE